MQTATARIMSAVPIETIDWLLEPDNPAVSVLTRRTLLCEPDSADANALWARRNEYPPVARILEAQREDGSWDVPTRDYQKYGGSLWQIVFLGELWADGEDARVKRAAEYAFSRQKEDGGWNANANTRDDMPCLTANVGRGLARMGWAGDDRVRAALASIVEAYERLGYIGCPYMHAYTLNGYCHMTTPKVLMFLGEVRDMWPEGTQPLRDACVEALRDKEVHRSLPAEFAELFQSVVWPAPAKERAAARERFIAESQPLHYRDKPGWLRFGFPLSYNSDALEALASLMAVGETRRPEYEAALAAVSSAADEQMRWTMRTSFNGKMIASIEAKGKPSKWLTLRALQVLDWFAEKP